MYRGMDGRAFRARLKEVALYLPPFPSSPSPPSPRPPGLYTPRYSRHLYPPIPLARRSVLPSPPEGGG